MSQGLLGTAGPISMVKDIVAKDEDFILMNGDVVTKLNFKKMIKFHRDRKLGLTIGYTIFKYRSPFGILEIKDNLLTKITEKPVSQYSVSAGIYVINREVIDFVPKNTFYTMPELIRKLLKFGYKVGVYRIKEFWLGLENMEHFNDVIKKLSKIKNKF
jgi:NDP-sugar pyrophosphorylase family protein